jgi:3-carboxy-cis,cis-muconate cycloisomerase
MLVAGMAQEHERAAGAWQAEWTALSGLLNCTSGAVANTATILAGLEVDPERMRGNLEAAGGMAAAERLMTVLAERIGRVEAQAALRTAVSLAHTLEITLTEALTLDIGVSASVRAADIEGALDPLSAVGNARVLIDRALAAWRGKA